VKLKWITNSFKFDAKLIRSRYLSGQLIGHFTNMVKIHRRENHQYFEHGFVGSSTWKTKFEKVTVIRQSCRYEKKNSWSLSQRIYSNLQLSICVAGSFISIFGEHFWIWSWSPSEMCVFMLMDWADSITRMRLLQLIKLRLGRWARAFATVPPVATEVHRRPQDTIKIRVEQRRWDGSAQARAYSWARQAETSLKRNF
jgi:hypothetical protein